MEPVYYGDIQVSISNERHYPDWTISEFNVCKVRALIMLATYIVTPATYHISYYSFMEIAFSFGKKFQSYGDNCE